MSRNTHSRSADHHGTDVDTSLVIDGDIGSYLSGTGLHTVLSGLYAMANSGFAANSGITVTEADGSPLVNGVHTLKFSNGTVTDLGSGVVQIANSGGGGGAGPFEDASLPGWWRFKSGENTLADETETAIMALYDDGSAELSTGGGAGLTLGVNFYGAGGGSTAKHYLLGGNGVVVPALSSDPASGDSEDGQIYYNTSTGKFRVHEGGSWADMVGTGGGGAPADATYLTTTANGTLTNEVVVGTTPGGELGGTWASPTVDATHAGSSHASVQSAAEATAASALSTHAGLPDVHHARQHSITSGSDHTFPGGTSDFLRADGTFATPPGGGSITVEEADGTPSVASVTTIKVGNGDLTDEGSGVVRIKTAADAGVGGGDVFYQLPDVTNYAAAFTSGSSSCAVTVTAPTTGDKLIAVVYATGRTANSITQTNVTWTKRYNSSGNSQFIDVWTGVCSGTGGTTATAAFTGNNSQLVEIFTLNGAPSAFTSATAAATGTAASTALATVSASNLTVGSYVLLATVSAGAGSSYSGASHDYRPLANFGGQGRSGIFRANGKAVSYWSLSSSAVSYFTAIITLA